MKLSVADKNIEPRKPAVPDNENQLITRTDIEPSAWIGFLERLRKYVGTRVEPSARDDVVGDILLRLVQHQDKLVAARNPMAWVTRVAANAVTDHYRRQSTELRAVTKYGLESQEMSGSPSPESSTSDAITNCISPLVESLPKPYRDALKLVELDDLNQKEAAVRLGLSLSGMKSRVQRGRVKLKQALLRCCAIQIGRRGEVPPFAPRVSDCAATCHAGAKRPGTP